MLIYQISFVAIHCLTLFYLFSAIYLHKIQLDDKQMDQDPEPQEVES